jgi:hypothetical protein
MSAQAKLLEDAMSRIHEAQAIVGTVGTDISHNAAPDDDVRARVSLALAGAETLLDAAWESIDSAMHSPGRGRS